MFYYALLLFPIILLPLLFKYKVHIKEFIAHKIIILAHEHTLKSRPKRIILLRHGETTANLDAKIYSTTPDNKITLTPTGEIQAKSLGKTLHKLIQSESILFYISTFTRCSKTFENLVKAFKFNKTKVIYDPRI